MPDPQSHFSPEAEDIFAEYLSRTVGGEPGDFKALCARHPDLADELRVLKSQWDAVAPLLARVEQRESLPKRPGEKPVQGDDPEVPPAGEARQSSSDSPGDLLRRLQEHRPHSERYTILGEQARGGMGAILRVWDQDLRRMLAMKVVLGREHPEAKSGTPLVEPKTLGRFLEEAQVTGQLDHPGIVPVHELGLAADGRVYFTMRLVKGRDLRHIFDLAREETEGWSQTRALGVLLKVCEAMAYAHDKGVIHRDLKPANVMVGKYGEVYVMDWGLARVLGRDDKHDLRIKPPASTRSVVKTERHELRDETPDSPLVTMDGDVVGTPSYMPPEQAKGQLDKLGPWSDVYSLGAMLYQLLSGEMPYVPRDARMSQHTILLRVIEGPPKSLLELAPRTAAELIAICDKSMAREPSDRYRDIKALADDLRAYLEGRVVHAYEAGAWAELRKWISRNRPLAASLGATALILVGGILVSTNFAVKAKARATEADRLRDAAVARTDAVWAMQELKGFHAMDDDLEYARSRAPQPAYEWWLEQAHELVDGRAGDPTRGIHGRPGLAEHQRLLAEIHGNTLMDPQEQKWWVDQLTQLEIELSELRARVAIAERSVLEPDARRRWVEAIDAIATSPIYGGLRITPQLDLLPIGPDPGSMLWEFAHLPTGEPAVRATDGKLILEPAMGIVFVLLPGGRVPVEDGKEPKPLNEVELAPFFLSKYEMTIEQWSRLSTWNGHFAYAVEAMVPANSVTWYESMATLERIGAWVGLPTEAQWEFGCRAGTTTTWWTGADASSLKGAANLELPAMQTLKDWPQPIGQLRANAFGLYDVHGNIREFCRDGPAYRDTEFRSGDGKRIAPPDPHGSFSDIVVRGGGYDDEPRHAGSSLQMGDPPDLRYSRNGLRPARALTP